MSLTTLITPTNISSEKEKFFSIAHYNPQFTYEWDSVEIQNWLTNDPNYRKFAEAVLAQDHQQITNAGEILFDNSLNDEVLKVAEIALQKKPIPRSTPPIEYIVGEFQNAMDFLNIHYQIVFTDEHGFNFRKPANQKNTLLISRHLNLQFFSLDGEINHELLHIIREENGQYNQIPKSVQYLPTEEGLASYFQDYSGEDGASSLFQHAAEYAVMKVGRIGSFSDMVEFLVELGFSKELAWQRVLRHKLGFQDTSLPGDNMKSSMYFFHEQKIAQLSDEERLRLLMGKFRVNELEKYRVYQGYFAKEKLADFYSLKI